MRTRKYVLLAAALLLSGAALAAGVVETETLTGVRQINKDGFNIESNKYAFSMAVYKGSLYVGTLNIRKMPGMWNFFTGTSAKKATDGAEVWRYDSGGTWTRVVNKGLGDRLNLGVRKMAVIKDCLYGVTANHDEGMEVWRTCDGKTWERPARGGFGDALNTSGRGLGFFDGRIYVGTENRKKGAQLWRSEDGDHWEKVADQGLGDKGNWWFSDFAVFNDRLYLGTLNVKGMQLFRSADGKSFERVFKDGPAKKTDMAAMKLYVFQGRLFVSTMDYFKGFDLYVTSDGENYRRILKNGFNDRHNGYLWQMEEYNGRLYAGTYSHHLPLPVGAFNLLSSADGDHWIVENADGFGNRWYYGIRSMAVFDGKLILGTASAQYGCKVFEAAAKGR
jgi:hypothetical protein